MEPKEFIEILHEVVTKDSIRSLVKNLENPPGRKPDEKLLALSKWFNDLESDEKRKLIDIMELAIDYSVFGFLCVIDGVRSVRQNLQKNNGEFKLIFKRNGEEYLINNPEKDFLHDLYKEL